MDTGKRFELFQIQNDAIGHIEFLSKFLLVYTLLCICFSKKNNNLGKKSWNK